MRDGRKKRAVDHEDRKWHAGDKISRGVLHSDAITLVETLADTERMLAGQWANGFGTVC